ncbi:type I polyketide synthase [Ruminiclostridium cellulolyticum]|uniref:Beta-ketoacyl synthase n=1 Tax=Ruminiclostridium cellulolyticum (strain ATCC 35319 / DSM 5812 / JCM 6584 / H10) TaxID=394503 RepID=B8I5D0_RUMCH|nr:type I polyketide synthase [Ruminiclostridium cellulolyticum]ACL76666.1 Beta-ketoacyl synthase [Ruminiclostridium cellulolyticum H10]
MGNFEENGSLDGAIAIIGMAGRFPGANNTEEFWENLYNGVESVKFFNHDDLIKMGIDEHLLDNPKYVAADAILDGMDMFDAEFFDYSAREAEITDPQHRLFLESAWEVLESAGYNSDLYDGRIAVYASANLSGYMVRNLYSNPGLVESLGSFKIMIANGQDFLATKVSYKMNLMGPSVNVNTLCSSSMVAVHYACQSLNSFECDIALAGGVSFQVSRNETFFYQEGGIGSADGHCRAFDSKANGTVSGSGLGILALKRLEDAIADGDCIHAIIKGTGINNDGSSKNSYTAPNVDGQAECIAEAIEMSGVNPETITYIDAHGTGTNLGDPIEIAALTKAFRAYTDKKEFCAIGSAKTNIGHLVNAGGLASMIKTVLSMKHRIIPASLNFEEPNPKIDFVNSPFYVNSKLSKWETEGFPIRAAVSSFGIGGTNTHVILEEAPAVVPSENSQRPYQLISLSAKTETALEKMTQNLVEHIKKNPDLNLADIAFTQHVGRRSFNHRRIMICKNLEDLETKISNSTCGNVISYFQKHKDRPVIFMFPGEGKYLNECGELYRTEEKFRNSVDYCADILFPMLGTDIKAVLDSGSYMNNNQTIERAAVFVAQYSMSKLLQESGLKPESMVGEGLGEYVCACISGVMSLEDSLRITAAEEEDFPGILSEISLSKPQIPFVSSFSGKWIEDSQATNTDYWLKQRNSSFSAQGLKEILSDDERIFVEIGNGKRFISEEGTSLIYVQNENKNQEEAFMECLGKIWVYGGNVNWNKFYEEEKRHRIPLPTYPFERQRYWIEPGVKSEAAKEPEFPVSDKSEIDEKLLAKCSRVSISASIELNENTYGLETHAPKKKQIEEMLLFKEKLEKLCSEFEGKINISPLLLKGSEEPSCSDLGGAEKLSKRPRPDLDVPYVEPVSETEKIIAEHWKKVLGFEKLGIHDDFFELGGHSLIAAAVATDLSKIFRIQIPMTKLLETTTIASVAEMVETYQWAVQGEGEAAAAEEDMEGGTI